MFILKKFQKQNSEQSIVNNGQQFANRGVQKMDQHLQRKFARGIQYNMKIIIRGDRNVGKTCLFYRLQGDKFHEEYVSSEEIKVASIQWNYNATDDIVKVEIWDIVDKGKKRENLTSTIANSKDILKMHNNPQPNTASSKSQTQSNEETSENSSSPALDAEFVDVYKGTNGVIFLFDMTKAWTFEYITREIHRCPLHIPILILANHRDMGHHRVITADQVHGFIDSILQEDIELNRKRTGQIRYSESSMRNGFGLRSLYKFFNLPYLHLQRETMLKQLERNMREIEATCQELDAMADSEEYSYDNFLEMLTNRRRMLADQHSATKSKSDTPIIPVATPPRSASMPANMASVIADKNAPETPQILKPMPSIIIGANNPLPPKFQQQFQKKSPNKANNLSASDDHSKPLSSVKNIEDFIPDDGEQSMFRKFLDEPTLPQTDLPPVIDEEDSEDEESSHNNLVVAKYQEELDPEDMIVQELKIESQTQNKSNQFNDLSLNNGMIKEENEMSSEPEDNQDEKLVNAESSNVESEENHNAINLNGPVLNCDDIEALENLYISKHSDQNRQSDASLSQLEEQPSKTTKKSNKSSNQNNVTKKKKKITKNPDINNTNLVPIENGDETTARKKKTKLKTKHGSKNSQTKQKQSEDPEDYDRKQLEEFLGPDLSENIKPRDHSSYQMF